MTTVAQQAFIIPGLNGSGPSHWQTRWEQQRTDCVRVRQRDWNDPDPDEWTGALHRAVRAADTPLVLVAHSLGCLLVDHAARHFGDWGGQVRAALLVAPCDPERPGAPAAVTRFAAPVQPLPFRTIVVASRDDPYASLERSRCFAERWGSSFVDAGELGHINADSDLGDWPFGQVLLEELFGPSRHVAMAASLRTATLARHPLFGCGGGG